MKKLTSSDRKLMRIKQFLALEIRRHFSFAMNSCKKLITAAVLMLGLGVVHHAQNAGLHAKFVACDYCDCKESESVSIRLPAGRVFIQLHTQEWNPTNHTGYPTWLYYRALKRNQSWTGWAESLHVVSENRINGVSGKRTPENPNPGDEVWFGHEYAVSEPIEIEVKISSQQWRDGSGACHQTSSENWLSIEAEGASISPTKSQLENIPTSLEPGAIPETWNWPANGFTGSVFAGKAISSKSGRSWTANVKIISYNPSLGRVEGEIEWPSLNSVHKIVGELTGSNFTFKEVDYIKKGSANLNCEYTTTISNTKISGTWYDPSSADNGTIEFNKQENAKAVEPHNGFTGSVFVGKAISSKSGKSWTATVRIISYNQSSGRVEGEIEWPSLNSVHKIVGNLTGSNFTFKEVDYIKKGRANLNCEYTTTISNYKISGTWSDPSSADNGTFESIKQENAKAVEPHNGFTGSVFAGKAISSKSGKSWTATVRIISYNQSSGRVEGEIEWPSLNSVHKIIGELTGSNFIFKEVDYIKQGSANLNCDYTTTISNYKISGTWSDPSSADIGTIELTKK